KSPDGMRLTAMSRGGRLSMKAAFVVDATGKRAAFARGQGARKVLSDLLLGAFVFFDLDEARPLAETYTLVEAWEEGWWYSAPLPGSKVVVACMSDADMMKRAGLSDPSEWLASLARTRHTAKRVAHAKPAGRPSVHVAYSHRLDRVTGDRWLASGDAASAFDPLSSQGIFKALRSGVFASYAILDYFKGTRSGLDKYEEIVAREFEDYLETWMDFYGRERRWERSEFWRRRQGRITLDPHCLLRARVPSGHLERLRMQMPVDDLKTLHELCGTPRPAHEVVSAFRNQKGEATTDRRIILALQYLIEQRVVECEEGSRS
ncbi:MAG TPA: tryptophan 7-halogenase, partial [Blastocatellia bacterium]|nr:tryptophan 7-halogenase [Blastocatellia bacterium]